jgi:nucleotide-binding universal stress UspA family protein
MLRLLATYYIGPAFAVGASLVFALLLLSAVNTAVTDLVSIQYMMSHDRELPSWLGALNRFGMPFLPLAIGCLVPLVTVLAVPDVGGLADLYAIGVVGAIAVNLGTCSTNFALPIKKWERAGMMGLSVLMVVVWCTIAWEKPHALAFAMSVLAIGLAGRWAAHNQDRIRAWMMQPVGLPWEVETQPKWSPVPIVTVPIGAAPAIAAPSGFSPAVSATSPAATSLPPAAERPKGRIMVAARGGNPKLLSFAVQESKSRGAELFVLFVRYVAVSTFGPTVLWNSDTDAEAQSLFREAQRMCDEAGVPVRFLYSVAPDLADTILEMASTYGVDVLLLGATQRGVLWRTMKGDIIQKVAQLLPESISLLIHA